ncbi:flavin-containing monooxygenase [Belnapia rosea]|uniref:Predicted flavoprotein CzcO associated with the cation diffusion facilitator CzcD n=1 Tax=Belnapia rosea TaxID=938405 RepID=A0A1G7AXE9_9PROT|nr:NAD(P)/FAD-dependent oxidoreductase [Belnapia rosea]SDB74921.1 Predicted flavoprotein CzcO associated with the cation diffusion facilitator CzcD [Belnapia rosea]SDE19558.1 Predicted flavoprotein CzcO associated with the cation diffusion facilitator CzcD [Belnapia rosea]
MTTMTETRPRAAAAPDTEFDAIVIGAGMSGLYQLIRLRELGLGARVFEAGTGVGGTWYWNRYPGCRFDSESYSYCYSFDKDLLQEWSWSEHFAPQPETERYLNRVADKYDLRRDIQFNARVRAAEWDEASRSWTVTLEDGSRHRSRFLITAIGALSAPTMPNFPGIGDFRGQSFHTGLWPKEPVDFAGKRVAVIGTGASGVQTIQEVAKAARELVVFQRTPNWCAPLHNAKIPPEEMEEIRTRYDEIFRRCDETFSCFLHTPDPRNTFDVSAEEREAFLEKLYSERGFGIWVGNFKDMLTNREANRVISNFVANKIRQRVKDPKVAEKLIPTNHGFGTRRVPLETNYYEVYNQPNVTLVDTRETPIERITETGIRTSERDYEFDIIVYATGFDALRGAFDRIDFRGKGGVALKEKWKDGATSLVGMLQDGFPNMFMLLGPHAALGNIPRSIEFNVDWVTRLLHHMRANGLTRAEATPEAMAKWMDHVMEVAQGLLSMEVDSWMTGVNVNVEGRQVRRVARYTGSAPTYRAWAEDIAARGYAGLALS